MDRNDNRFKTTKMAPPPLNLPINGRVGSEAASFIGRTNYVAALEDKRFIFGIKRGDRTRHLYIVGKNGVGKSKLLELLIRQDVAYGHGLALLDFEGDLIDSVLEFIPRERVKDAVVLNAADGVGGLVWNPLRNVLPLLRHQFTDGFADIFKKLFRDQWHHRTEHLLRFAVLALLDHPEANLADLPRLLGDSHFRAEAVSHIQDETIKNFWAAEFSEWALKFDAETISPAIGKLNQFFSHPALRQTFSSREDKVNLPALIAQKRIILINVSKVILGEENAAFLGALWLLKLREAGLQRLANRETGDGFYLYLDECQRVVTGDFDHFLSGAVKYGFCLTLAHQYMGQLPSEARTAIMGNFANFIVFRVSGEDALRLESEMAPVFRARDMTSLGTGEFFIKMLIDGETADPFSAETLKVLEAPHESFREEIIRFSKEKYNFGKN